MLEAHNDALTVRRETWRKRHTWKITDDLTLTACQVHHENSRLSVDIGHVGDFLAFRVEARSYDKLTPIAQQSEVFTVLVHNSEAFQSLILWTGLINEHNTGVEIPALQRHLLIDLI